MNAPAPYEPKLMKHPHARKGVIHEIKGKDAVSGREFTDYQGDPDVFPDVTVKDANTEAYYRSRGYLVPGEVPPPPAEYSEYPVMLVHPDHVDAIPDDFAIEKGDNGEIIRHRIPGSPEQFPSMIATSKQDEKRLGAKGYKRAGADDPEAIRRSKANPYKAGRETQEFPKMVDGHVVDPHANRGGPAEYPKWVGEKLVNNRAEEEAITGKQATATVVETCIICGEGITPQQAKGTGVNGAFHMDHLGTLAAPKPVKATTTAAKAQAPVPVPKGPVLADGRAPLPVTARESRKAAREAAAAGGRKKPGPKPKMQVEA